MKKLIKTISIVLCFTLITTTFAGASGNNYLPNVDETTRIIDGIKEFFVNVWEVFTYTSKTGTQHLCPIPELDSNYVPQGFCYIDSMDMFAVTFYSADDLNSIVSLIDAKTGERIRTVVLHYEDGSDCKAHVGGCADIGDSLIISSGKSARRLKLDDILASEDYGNVNFCGKLNTDMQASYLNAYGNKLLVGQYYSFTADGTYDTPAEQRLKISSNYRNYAMCEVFDLTDMDSVFEAEEAVPELMISVPNSVQGIAYDGKQIVTSTSTNSFGNSYIEYYKLSETTDYCFNLKGQDVPLQILVKGEAYRTVRVEPMSEGIDFYNGKVAGIFESGANKFVARVKTGDICVFE